MYTLIFKNAMKFQSLLLFLANKKFILILYIDLKQSSKPSVYVVKTVKCSIYH